MYFLNKLTRFNKLEPGIYVLCGLQGMGKTSLGSALLKRDYIKYQNERFLNSFALISQLRQNGYPNLRLDKNLYFCSNWLALDKAGKITAWDVEFTKLGFPNDNYKVQNLPYGAVLFFPDVDQVINSHDNVTGINAFLRGFFKYIRHYNVTVILDMQDFDLLAKDIRRLTRQVIHVVSKKTYKLFSLTLFTQWKLKIIDMTLVNLFNSLKLTGIKFDEKMFIKNRKFRFYGDIHKYYNDKSALPYFLNNVDHFDYIPTKQFDFTKIDFDEFIQTHPYVADSSFKRNAKANNDNLDEEIKKKVTVLTKQFKEYLYGYFNKENDL